MKIIQCLNGTWQWKSNAEQEFHEGIVPGSVLCDMLRLNMIQDPFWRTNEYATRELMAQDYVYTRNFVVDEKALKTAKQVYLVCEGIDTIAAIYINNRLVAKVDDMHRAFRFDVKAFLQENENTIQIDFSSALRFVREEDAKNDIFYASTGCIPGNAALRKAHSMFGWDWGPQLPDAGIFRDISLEYLQGARLSDVRIHQQHVSQGEVVLQFDAQIERFDESTDFMLCATVQAPDGEVFSAEVAQLSGCSVSICAPQLWWPNGLGRQPLYKVTLALMHKGVQEDVYSCRIGLRTITVSTAKDEYGNEFAFVVNGVKIFAMGANYVPQDSLISRVTPQSMRKLVQNCADANFNCLRVWGGGYYPDDAFYDACDEYGILVWQDLMFACNVYALTPAFEENIVAETKDIARRLRHRASLALWCGNNEMEWGWGDEWQRIKGHHPRYKADYTKIFELVLSRALQECDDVTFYWPSSPSSGGAFDAPNVENRGDQHYWEVWHSGKPFTEYRKNFFRFCSEYGFQSFPHSKTINSFTLPQDRNIFSRVMESHQKNGMANSKIFTYISDYFLYPKNLDYIAYISQILQLKAVQYGVEHWRRNRGRCMGSLYWQLNDCWPVASWASIDYFGRWKALHYGAKRFYAGVMASACEKEELSTEIDYFVHNDTLQSQSCVLEIALLSLNFEIISTQSKAVEIAPLSARLVLSADFAEHNKNEEDKQNVFAQYRLLQNGQVVSSGTTLFVKPKHFSYPKITYTKTVQDLGEYFDIRIAASAFAQYVEIYFEEVDAVFSDNFFDITSAEGTVLRLQKSDLSRQCTAGELEKQLVVRSVVDSFDLPVS